jgi:soluble lytic murein transglycosylase-like protein
MQSLLLKLEADIAARKARQRDYVPMLRTFGVAALCCVLAFQVGARSGQANTGAGLNAAAPGMDDLRGSIELQQAYIDRMERVYRNSSHYGIPADLAAAIEDIALAEKIEPRIAFELVRVESRFNPNAVSPAGALGLTQLMPETAAGLSPGIRRSEIFDRETNLRLGFRFLSSLIDQYDGDVRLALLAYNRGPTRVNGLLAEGRDPGNGYARMILGH